MTDYQTVTYETREQVAWIMLDRPKMRNAQNMRMINELDDAFVRAGGDDEVRVVVLGGNGPSFSSGHDLSISRGAEGLGDDYEDRYFQRRAQPETTFDHEDDMYVEKCMRIRDFAKPTIAMVQGHAVAAGWMVASMCDLIVASEGASFANPVLRMAACGAELPVEFWDVGVRKAKELLFTGDYLSAEDGHRLGFINHVVPEAELGAFTGDLAARIVKMPPATVRLTKKSMNKALDRVGQSDVFWEHFLMHQFSHQTQENRDLMARVNEAQKKGGHSLKQYLQDRDR